MDGNSGASGNAGKGREVTHPIYAGSLAPCFKRVARWIGMPGLFVADVSGQSTRLESAVARTKTVPSSKGKIRYVHGFNPGTAKRLSAREERRLATA
jgi:hypothetical protein